MLSISFLVADIVIVFGPSWAWGSPLTISLRRKTPLPWSPLFDSSFSFVTLPRKMPSLKQACASRALFGGGWRERNFRVFRNQSRSHELLSVEIQNSIRSGAIYLNLQITPILSASWNLPTSSSIQVQQSLHIHSPWTLLIILLEDFSVGVTRKEGGNANHLLSVQEGNPFSAASEILKLAAEEGICHIVQFFGIWNLKK